MNIQQLDEMIVLWVVNHLRCPFLDEVMPFISWLGNHGMIWILIGIFLFLMGGSYRKQGLLILFALAATAIVANLYLKPTVARVRPFDLLSFKMLIDSPTDFSFPSGHTAAAFAAATAAFMENKKFGIGMGIFAILMAFSRLYLGVHFPTDVLAGAFIGVVTSTGVVFCANKWIFKVKYK